MKRETLLTIILALIWCSIIVLATLSPIAQTGGSTNQFGDAGMWSGIGFILVLFLLPLYLQANGIRGAKIILGIIVGIFIIGAITVAVLAGIFILKSFNIVLGLISVCCMAYIVLSIVWYVNH